MKNKIKNLVTEYTIILLIVMLYSIWCQAVYLYFNLYDLVPGVVLKHWIGIFFIWYVISPITINNNDNKGT
jgi:hypothetical protein